MGLDRRCCCSGDESSLASWGSFLFSFSFFGGAGGSKKRGGGRFPVDRAYLPAPAGGGGLRVSCAPCCVRMCVRVCVHRYCPSYGVSCLMRSVFTALPSVGPVALANPIIVQRSLTAFFRIRGAISAECTRFSTRKGVGGCCPSNKNGNQTLSRRAAHPLAHPVYFHFLRTFFCMPARERVRSSWYHIILVLSRGESGQKQCYFVCFLAPTLRKEGVQLESVFVFAGGRGL